MFILFWTRPVPLVFLTSWLILIMSFFLLSCTAHEICPELEDRMASTGGFVHARLCIDQTPTSAIAAAISCWSVESWVMWLKKCHKPSMTCFFLISPIYSEIGNGLLFFLPTFRHLWRGQVHLGRIGGFQWGHTLIHCTFFQPQPWLHFGASTSASDAFSRPVELLRAFSNSPWPWLDGHLLRGSWI